MKIVIDITPEEIHSFMKKEPCMQGSDNGKSRYENCLALLIELLIQKGIIDADDASDIKQGDSNAAIALGIRAWLEKNYISPLMQQPINRKP